MKAVVFDAIGSVSVKDMPMPRAGTGEVVIKVAAVGLCGTDEHIFHGTYPAKYPLIPGHEFAGSIFEIGAGVTGWKIGDRVAVDPNCHCLCCYYCQRDEENMCENPRISGVTHHGGFAEYALVPARTLYSLPDNVSWEEGAFVEPLACVAYAMNRLRPKFGDKAIIFGAGPMGLLVSKALKVYGTSHILMVDIALDRLQTAEALGVEICADTSLISKRFPRGFDIVVDCSGQPSVIQNMFQYAAKRARILQFGCADSDAKIEISPFEIYDNDWEYIGTRALLLTFRQAIDMIADGVISGDKIINDIISLDQVPLYLRGGKPAASLKVIVKPSM